MNLIFPLFACSFPCRIITCTTHNCTFPRIDGQEVQFDQMSSLKITSTEYWDHAVARENSRHHKFNNVNAHRA